MKSNKKILNISILGASGYTGAELIRLVLGRTELNIVSLSAEKHANKKLGSVFSQFKNINLPTLQKIENIDFNFTDIVFSCLPPGFLNKIISRFPSSTKIIDLSPDYRFNDYNIYEKYYDKHYSKDILSKVPYGLPELYREKIKSARIVACPGCYPTSILIPLIPLVLSKLIEDNDIIIDSKSGATGAGRNLNTNMLFSEVDESIKAYGNGNHRHKPEIEEQLELNRKKNISIVFTPHLIPMKRGILSTIYVKGNYEEIYNELFVFYKKENFIQLLEIGDCPSTGDVVGSNNCRIGVIKPNNSNYTVIVSVIDNLIKGASGQALQNMNIMFGYKEDLGLAQQAFYP